jgi:hypothetical protein
VAGTAEAIGQALDASALANSDPPKSEPTRALIHWSVQEVHPIATRLAQQRIQPALVVTWSLWRRAHQAAAQRSHLKQKSNCSAKP